MEKKIFKTVDEVAEYLNSECYYKYLDTDCYKELENIEVEGYKKFISGEKSFNIYFGLEEVCAIFATENEEDIIQYIWRSRYKNDFEYEVFKVDNKAIAELLPKYAEYISNGGCFDISRWLLEEEAESKLSFDYDVLTAVGKLW